MLFRPAYIAAVTAMVRDTSMVLDLADMERALDTALRRLNMDAPNKAVEDVSWLSDGYFGPLPAGWNAASSEVVTAEHPAGVMPAAMLGVAVHTVPPNQQRLVAERGLAAGSVVRLAYTVPHVLSAAQDTVADALAYGVQGFAAHVLCLQLATHYSSDRDSSLAADQSASDGRSRAFAARAREYRAAYFDALGKPDPQARQTSGGAGGGAAGGAGGLNAAASMGALPGRGRGLGVGSLGAAQ